MTRDLTWNLYRRSQNYAVAGWLAQDNGRQFIFVTLRKRTSAFSCVFVRDDANLAVTWSQHVPVKIQAAESRLDAAVASLQ